MSKWEAKHNHIMGWGRVYLSHHDEINPVDHGISQDTARRLARELLAAADSACRYCPRFSSMERECGLSAEEAEWCRAHGAPYRPLAERDAGHPEEKRKQTPVEVAYAAMHVAQDKWQRCQRVYTKAAAEARQLALLREHRVELVVLARYMQVLSNDFLERFAGPVINIHHSFLPAFAGGRPYHQAYSRGVKLIGATGHYATRDLDEGPIIQQDVRRVTHRHSVEDLVRMGRDMEKTVLAQAVRWHLENRVLVYGNKTVVFD
jgi:folate-dependent phosphoribosylglycinamide formyltransferase PurN